MHTRVLVLAALAFLAPHGPLVAQPEPMGPPRGHVGISFLAAEPLGEFKDFVSSAFGAGFSGRVALDPAGVLSLRADLGFLIYGHESKRVCIGGVGCRVEARLDTSNNIFYGGIGPELALPLGWVRPYANASLGFGYFNTSSSLKSTWGGDEILSTENFGDGSFSWGAGGGLEIPLSRGRTPVALDLGVRYHRNGTMEYLRKGDIVDHPDGSITLFPIRSEADFLSYRLGVSIGIPSGGGEDEGRFHRDW
jgi:opacity protein-like surface antigen